MTRKDLRELAAVLGVIFFLAAAVAGGGWAYYQHLAATQTATGLEGAYR